MKNFWILPFLIFIIASCQKSKNEDADNRNMKGTESISAQREIIDINPGANEKPLNDLIQVKTPMQNDTISSPLKITGRARGYWFFEADFPIVLVGDKEKEISIAIATADGEWMTEDFVNFSAELKFSIPQITKGYVIFKRSNASGLPEHDRALKIPVIINP